MAIPYFLTRTGLMGLKLLALRRRVWFKALSKVERSLVDLTLRVVSRVRSIQLAKALLNIADKLQNWISSRKTFKEIALEAGLRMAKRMVKVAVKLNVEKAYEWLNDQAYVFYLGVSYLNTSKVYRA
ncbi:MAG: hypothetical protein QXR74_06310 [Candidatus Bathyarchaeia archaeon]